MNTVVDLPDTITQPTSAMRQAMFDAAVGDDVFVRTRPLTSAHTVGMERGFSYRRGPRQINWPFWFIADRVMTSWSERAPICICTKVEEGQRRGSIQHHRPRTLLR